MYWMDVHDQVGGSKQVTYYADSASDVQNLPTDPEVINKGSVCLIISTGEVYMLNSSYEWEVLGG